MPTTDPLIFIQNYTQKYYPDFTLGELIYANKDKDPMTRIYPLDNPKTDQHFVVKYLCHVCELDESERINEQLKIAASLSKYDGIVKLLDYPYRYENNLFELIMLMDHLTPLQDIMMETSLDDETVIRLAFDLLKGLSECHKQKLAHRDIKPENIFRNKDGHYELGDFDISAYLQADNDIKGDIRRDQCTAYYAAPEILMQETNIDHMRSDVYSLSLVIYYLLNDKEMPWGKNGQKTIEQQRCECPDIPLPNTHLHSFAAACVIWKGLSFDPQKRYASAVEMLEDLQRAVSDDKTCIARNEYMETMLHLKSTRIRAALVGACICAVLLIGIWALLGRTIPPVEQGTPGMISGSVIEKVSIHLTQIPEYGSDAPFLGTLSCDDPSDYRVTLYLRLQDSTEFYVKPTKEQSYVPVEADGTFSIDYVSGLNDENAVELYLFLIPGDFRPTNNIESAKEKALYAIHILRSSSGTIETEYGTET